MTDIVKPSEKPRWATDVGAAIVTPPIIKQDSGWVVEYPPHQFFNWLHRRAYDWINYFEAHQDTSLGGVAETELTISVGEITPTSGIHTVDTESDAASDDLTTIHTTNLQDGRLLLLRSASAARVITIKHNAGGAGQIALTGGVDLILSDPSEFVLLKRTGTDWEQVFTSQLGSDLTPFLGGDLDVRSRKIYSTILNQDIIIEPNGSGALAPETTGKALGKTDARWNLFATAGNFSGDISSVNSTFSGTMKSNTIDAVALDDTLNIGNTNALLVNIGRAGATIALYGSITEIHTTNTYVSDKTITLNDGGLAGSGSGVGIEVEENDLITGYIKTSANRNKWSFLSPGDAEIISIGTECVDVGDIGIVSNALNMKFSEYELFNASGTSIFKVLSTSATSIGTSGNNINHTANGGITYVGGTFAASTIYRATNNLTIVSGTNSIDFFTSGVALTAQMVNSTGIWHFKDYIISNRSGSGTNGIYGYNSAGDTLLWISGMNDVTATFKVGTIANYGVQFLRTNTLTAEIDSNFSWIFKYAIKTFRDGSGNNGMLGYNTAGDTLIWIAGMNDATTFFKLGTIANYSVSFLQNSDIVGGIDAATQKWSIGKGGFAGNHIVNGGFVFVGGASENNSVFVSSNILTFRGGTAGVAFTTTGAVTTALIDNTTGVWEFNYNLRSDRDGSGNNGIWGYNTAGDTLIWIAGMNDATATFKVGTIANYGVQFLRTNTLTAEIDSNFSWIFKYAIKTFRDGSGNNGMLGYNSAGDTQLWIAGMNDATAYLKLGTIANYGVQFLRTNNLSAEILADYTWVFKYIIRSHRDGSGNNGIWGFDSAGTTQIWIAGMNDATAYLKLGTIANYGVQFLRTNTLTAEILADYSWKFDYIIKSYRDGSGNNGLWGYTSAGALLWMCGISGAGSNLTIGSIADYTVQFIRNNTVTVEIGNTYTWNFKYMINSLRDGSGRNGIFGYNTAGDSLLWYCGMIDGTAFMQIGTYANYGVSFLQANTICGGIDTSQNWTIGKTGHTGIHRLNTLVSAGDTTTPAGFKFQLNVSGTNYYIQLYSA